MDGVEVVKGYRTTDGMLFSDETGAHKHQAILHLAKALQADPIRGNYEGSKVDDVETFSVWLDEHRGEVLDYLGRP